MLATEKTLKSNVTFCLCVFTRSMFNVYINLLPVFKILQKYISLSLNIHFVSRSVHIINLTS